MAGKTYTKRLIVEVTEEQEQLIKERMALIGTTNFSQYARKMLIDGYIIKRDFSDIKVLTKELANLARSINQIVKRANETRSFYKQDVEDLQKYYYDVKKAVTERLVKMMEKD